MSSCTEGSKYISTKAFQNSQQNNRPCCHHHNITVAHMPFSGHKVCSSILGLPGKVEAAQSLTLGSLGWILTPLMVMGELRNPWNHNSLICKVGVRESWRCLSRGLLGLLLLLWPVRSGPRGYVADDEAEAQTGWGHSCGHRAMFWSAVLLPLHQSAKLGTLSTFYTGKAKWLPQGLGTFPWVPSPASLEPPWLP